jgi:hypothetical protein
VSNSSHFIYRFWFVPIILLTFVLGALTKANYNFAQDNPGGSDFLFLWIGTRELINNGISPYSELVAIKMQLAIYGRSAQPGEHELFVAYPIYATFIAAPFAMISDYSLARALWMTTLQFTLLGLVFVNLHLTGWRPGYLLTSLLLVFSLLWYHALRGIINGNVVILIALLIGLVFLALKARKDELAGVLLALTTIKPQVVLLLIIFIFIWAVSTRRWPLIFWFTITIVFLSLAGIALVPDWPLQNLQTVLNYPHDNTPGTPGAAFSQWWPGIGTRLGWGLTIIMAALLLFEWWQAHKADFRWFLWTACLTLVVGQWIGIETDPGNFIVMFIPLMLILATLEKRWCPHSRWIIVLLLLFLFMSLWVIFLYTVDMEAGAKQHPIMFFPLPAYLLLGLYWVRWYAIKSEFLISTLKRTLADK